jgi:uncharacterized membrane protein YdbT with pleckstrin-like domain
MQCKNCGASVPDGSAYCNRCGTDLSTGARPAAPPAAPPSTGPQPEQHVWSGRYSLKAMGGWILLLGCMGVIFLWYFLSRYIHEAETSKITRWIGWTMLIVFAVFALGIVIVGLKRKLHARYRLSTQRLFVERGLISRDVDELELIRVDDVGVYQNLIQRIFNVGDVKVMAPTDADSPTMTIEGIPDPVEVKEKIRNLTQELRKKSVRMEAI